MKQPLPPREHPPGRPSRTGTTGGQVDSQAGCYRAVVCADGKQHFLGRYATAWEAAWVLECYAHALEMGEDVDSWLWIANPEDGEG